MKTRYFSLICLLAGMLATTLSAQLADFSDHANYGVRNYTQHMAGEFAWQANQIEDNRFVVTAWPSITAGGNVTYFWQTYDKFSGAVNGPNLIQNATTTSPVPALGNPASVRAWRPAMTFTTQPAGVAGSYSGVALLLTQRNPFTAVNDVFMHFLRIDPATIPPNGNTPVYIYDMQRTPVNVSDSPANADTPGVAAFTNGQIVASWRDQSTVGTIGGTPGINPQLPNPNVGNLAASDVYVRRFRQQFDSMNPIEGVIDPAVPSSTVNVSTSQGLETYPTMISNLTDRVILVFQTLTSQTDDVAGSGVGAVGGTFGQETTDTFGRVVLLSTTAHAFNLNAGMNLSSSSGNSSFPSSLTYNATLNQVGLLFLDDTPLGGIGGNPQLNAVPQGPISNQVPVNDAFFGLYDTSLMNTKLVQVTNNPNAELLVTLASRGASGWFTAWGESVSTTQVDIRSRIRTYDGTALPQGATRQYPLQSVIPSGNPQPVWLFAATSGSSSHINLAFAMAGTPDDLKAGQPAAVANNRDLFMASGEPSSAPVLNGQVQITTFSVNDGQPIDPGSPPQTIEVEISLRNNSSNMTVNLTNVTIGAPQAFTQTAGLTLPITMTPGATVNATYTYNVNAPLLASGQNEFTIATTGDVAGNLTLSSGTSGLSVLGATGGIAGVTMTITLNPPAIRVGETTSGTFTVAVANASTSDLTGLSFEGALLNGMSPANLSGVAFQPSPSTTTVPAAGIETFTGTILIGSSVASQDWRPAFTLSCTQGTNTGSVTAPVTSSIQVFQSPSNNGGGTPVIGGLTNAGGGGGCALVVAGGNAGITLALIGLLVWYRRRKCAFDENFENFG